MPDTESTISTDFALLLHRIQAWWSAPPMPIRLMRELTWGGRDISSLSPTLRIDGADVVLSTVKTTIIARGESFLDLRADHDPLFGKRIDGRTEDDWLFAGRQAEASSKTTMSGGRVAVESVIRVWDWTLTSPGGSGNNWIGELHGELPAFLGNLSLVSGGGFTFGHYFLVGPEADYILLQQPRSRSRWLLVVRGRTVNAVTHSSVQRDLSAIAFSFGTTVGVRHLWAVDEEMKVRAILGGELSEHLNKAMGEQAPVPSTNHHGALPIVFFEKLASYLSRHTTERAAPITLASWYYVESVAERSANSALVKMALGAIVAARAVLQGDVALTPQPKEYEAWLHKVKDDISALERTDRPGLVADRLSSAAEASPLQVVLLAMNRASIECKAELRDALDSAIRCLDGVGQRTEDFYENFARLRVITAALVSYEIGYSGQLSGWEKAGRFSFYQPAPADWGNQDPMVSANTYRATIDFAISELANLWPEFKMPTVPTSGLWQSIQRFASSLPAKTEDAVFAEIRPLPLDGADERRYEFALRAAKQPSAKITLFVARDSASGIEIEGMSSNRTLTSATEVTRFLEEMANADETKQSVERLLLVSKEAGRYGAG